jgi:hypothetical protein
MLLTENTGKGTFNETDPNFSDINQIVSPPGFLHKSACPVFVATFDSGIKKI